MVSTLSLDPNLKLPHQQLANPREPPSVVPDAGSEMKLIKGIMTAMVGVLLMLLFIRFVVRS